MPPARSAAAAMLLFAAEGCGLGGKQPIAILEIAPAIGYDESALSATIRGQGFRPTYRFDAASGLAQVDVGGFSATLVSAPDGSPPARYPLAQVAWESIDLLGAEIPPEIPAGTYDLLVGDPSGRTVRRPAAFTSLGAEVTPPKVAINGAPAALVADGAIVSLLVTADDGYGRLADLQLTVTTTTRALQSHGCPLTGGATAYCPFSFPVPEPASETDALTIDAAATGGSGLVQHARLSLRLVPASTATAIAPNAGSTQGGTTVTLTGTNFLPSTAIAFDGLPGVVDAVTSTSITATVPPHPPGAAVVTVTTGGATATLVDHPFTYAAPPVVREVSPTTAPESGGGAIIIVGDGFTNNTVITFDGSPLRCARLVSAPNRIEGFIPPGAGTETISAFDPIGGAQPAGGVLFRYLPAPDGGAADGAVPDAAVLPVEEACPDGEAP